MTVRRSDVADEVRLIAILPADVSEDEAIGMATLVERGGATSVQVRMKSRSAGDVLSLCERLLSVITIPLYVNDRSDVARLAGAAGVHVGADDLDPASARAILPLPFRVGVSVGSLAEARAALVADVDYWSIGPFARTSTKSDAGPALGPKGFAELRSLAPPGMPVVAIGGISVDNVADAVKAGAAGVAVVASLFEAPDVEIAARQLRRAVDEALG